MSARFSKCVSQALLDSQPKQKTISSQGCHEYATCTLLNDRHSLLDSKQIFFQEFKYFLLLLWVFFHLSVQNFHPSAEVFHLIVDAYHLRTQVYHQDNEQLVLINQIDPKYSSFEEVNE